MLQSENPNFVASGRSMRQLLGNRTPVIAILHVENTEYAEPLLNALEEGGISTIEVTLRTAAALGVISTMRRLARHAIVGAGTITKPEQVSQARDAGARFLVSPAFSPSLARASENAEIPFLPGTVTPTEVLIAREHGYSELKFFPADLNGGVRWLRHVFPLFPDVSFCPTGGLSNENASEYLRQPNVFAVGGVYMASRERIENAEWSEIRREAKAAVLAAQG